MSGDRKTFGSGSVIGLLLVVIGALWVLNNLFIINFRIKHWWPLILIVIGLIHLVNSKKGNNLSAWILILLGGIFLLSTNEVVAWREIWRYWPVILILFGLAMIFKRPGGMFSSSSAEDEIAASVIFGGVEKNITGKNFKGGSISTIFGAVKVDLRSAELDPGGAVINASSIFGGATILVPKTWVIDIRSSAILGGIDNKCENEQGTEGKKLLIKADAIFGGIEIKN